MMNIPIAIVRSGNAEEYVKLSEKSIELYRKEDAIIKEHAVTVRRIYEHVAKEHPRNKGDRSVDAYYLRRENVWRHALTVEELSKQLIEIAGRLAEVSAEYRSVSGALSRLKEVFE